MISPEIQQALNTAIQNYGRMTVNDPQRAETLVQEAAGSNSREANLLLAALRAGVPQALVDGSADGAALLQRLQTESFMASDAAEAAVQAWATALGASVSFASPPIEIVEAPSAPVEMAPPPTQVVVPTPVEVLAPPPPAAAPPIAPAPPAAPVVAPPPQAAPAPQQQPYAYTQAPRPQKSNTGLIVAIVLTLVVAGLAVGAFFLFKKGKEAVDTFAKSPVTTTGIPVTPTTTGTTGSPAPTDLDAYNNKLVSFKARLDQLGQDMTNASKGMSTTDPNAAMDAAAESYTKASESCEVIASDIDALTPPAEAQGVHDVFRKMVRDMSSLLGEGATAARSHDNAAFSTFMTKLGTFTTESETQIEAALTAGGFDKEEFKSSGRLKKL